MQPHGGGSCCASAVSEPHPANAKGRALHRFLSGSRIPALAAASAEKSAPPAPCSFGKARQYMPQTTARPAWPASMPAPRRPLGLPCRERIPVPAIGTGTSPCRRSLQPITRRNGRRFRPISLPQHFAAGLFASTLRTKGKPVSTFLIVRQTMKH